MKEKQYTLDYFRKQGKRGGKMGGALAWQGLTKEERSARAKAAVAQRKWHPVKPKDEEEPSSAAAPLAAPPPRRRIPPKRKA